MADITAKNITQEKTQKFFLFMAEVIQTLKIKGEKGKKIFVDPGDEIDDSFVTITDIDVERSMFTIIKTDYFNQGKRNPDLYKKISCRLLFERIREE